jgi:hypothetical protein
MITTLLIQRKLRHENIFKKLLYLSVDEPMEWLLGYFTKGAASLLDNVCIRAFLQ